jgi:hypothetical protein
MNEYEYVALAVQVSKQRSGTAFTFHIVYGLPWD